MVIAGGMANLPSPFDPLQYHRGSKKYEEKRPSIIPNLTPQHVHIAQYDEHSDANQKQAHPHMILLYQQQLY
jgi:hypothetical protein